MDERDFLSVLKNTVFFVAVHLYFAGWIYNFYLYQHFGISLGSLDIPFYYFFVYSFTVIYLKAIWFTGIAVILVLLTVIVEKYQHIKKWVIPTFLILLFPLTFYLSRDAASKTALNIRKGKTDTKTIVFVFKRASNIAKSGEPAAAAAGSPMSTPDAEAKGEATPDPDTPTVYKKDFLDANQAEALRLIVQTSNKYYVFFQPPLAAEGSTTEGDEELDIGYTFEVLSSDVELATIVVP